VLTAQNNHKLLIEQALEFKPNTVVIGDQSAYSKVAEALQPHNIKVFAGEESIVQVVETDTVDMVLAAIVGFAGLRPTLRAIECGKPVALANKETLVVAGNLMTAAAWEKGVNIYPVDSEHSAIFQCLAGEFHNPVEKIILTASGGPFRAKDRNFLENATREQALNHPNWNMGNKVTIDSATLMNKGLEVIEAHWLFNVSPAQIEVVIHPQSVIHSMVQFRDGSIKAQMGLPDMRLPIQYAFSYPDRLSSEHPRYDFSVASALTFEAPDRSLFRNLDLAYEALKKGGNLPCILNAANEIAVEAFLEGRLRFLEMSDIIEKCMISLPYIMQPSLDDYLQTDLETRRYALAQCSGL
jgi:1-deoxy-D-xylulose-5-phosphate reductoisomerase